MPSSQATPRAEARVTRIEITKVEPFAAGQQFGSTGAYDKIVGRYHGELDPAHPLNATIVDLDKAPRNARGMVEYSADFYILRPADLAKGNGALFYEVSNRGNKARARRFNNAPCGNDPTTAEHAGNGFLMRQGFTLVWNGWMPGLPAGRDLLRIEVPTAGTAAARSSRRSGTNSCSTIAMQARPPVLSRRLHRQEPTPGLWCASRNGDEPDRHPVRSMGVRRRADDPPAAGGHAVPHRADLSTCLQRDESAGEWHRLCGDARLVSFLRHAAADDAGTANPLAAPGRPHDQPGAGARQFAKRALSARLHLQRLQRRRRPTGSCSTARIPTWRPARSS